MNSFGKLVWEFSPMDTKVDFLDLHLFIEGDRIVTQLRKKSLNLYLYLPPLSAHPPGVLKSIIYSRVQQIHLLCNRDTNKKKYTTLLFHRLQAQGYTPE